MGRFHLGVDRGRSAGEHVTRSADDNRIIDHVFELEGGSEYTDRPADKGGPTKYGITQATLSRWRGYVVIPAAVKELSEEEARQITYQYYIVDPGFNLLASPELRMALVDFTFLFGADDSVPALQRIVGTFPDGRLGRKTAAAADAAEARHVINALSVERVRLHCQKVVDDLKDRGAFAGSQAQYLRGWVNRATAFIR